MIFQVFHDSPLEIGDALESATADTLSGDLGEKAFDHIGPGSRGRRKVQMQAGIRLDLTLHGRGLMSGVVIDNKMEVAQRLTTAASRKCRKP